MKKTLAALLLGLILGSSAAVAQNAQHFQAANGDQGNPSYTFTSTPAAGSSVISVRNVSLGSLSEAIVIQFTVVKAVTS